VLVADRPEAIRDAYLDVHRIALQAAPGDLRYSVDEVDSSIGYASRQYGYDGWGMTADLRPRRGRRPAAPALTEAQSRRGTLVTTATLEDPLPERGERICTVDARRESGGPADRRRKCRYSLLGHLGPW
jgi:hypothetical protein